MAKIIDFSAYLAEEPDIEAMSRDELQVYLTELRAKLRELDRHEPRSMAATISQVNPLLQLSRNAREARNGDARVRRHAKFGKKHISLLQSGAGHDMIGAKGRTCLRRRLSTQEVNSKNEYCRPSS